MIAKRVRNIYVFWLARVVPPNNQYCSFSMSLDELPFFFLVVQRVLTKMGWFIVGGPIFS